MAKKKLLIAALAVVGALSMFTIGCAAITDQHAVVSGTVVADGLVTECAVVKQGDVLVNVKSLAGSNIAAARATTSGHVTQVLVQPGQNIVPQQVVAKISE